MDHHVSTWRGMVTVSPAHFAAQMAYLTQAGYRTAGTAQLSAFLAGEPLPPKSVVLTFDDGYLDNAFHKKYGYGLRARVEAQISRIKQCIGATLLTQMIASQEGEGVIIASILNLWNAFGKPVYVKNA